MTRHSRAMAPSKPRNSTFKVAVVAQSALKARFAIAVNLQMTLPQSGLDEKVPERAKLFLLHNPNLPQGTSAR